MVKAFFYLRCFLMLILAVWSAQASNSLNGTVIAYNADALCSMHARDISSAGYTCFEAHNLTGDENLNDLAEQHNHLVLRVYNDMYLKTSGSLNGSIVVVGCHPDTTITILGPLHLSSGATFAILHVISSVSSTLPVWQRASAGKHMPHGYSSFIGLSGAMRPPQSLPRDHSTLPYDGAILRRGLPIRIVLDSIVLQPQSTLLIQSAQVLQLPSVTGSWLVTQAPSAQLSLQHCIVSATSPFVNASSAFVSLTDSVVLSKSSALHITGRASVLYMKHVLILPTRHSTPLATAIYSETSNVTISDLVVHSAKTGILLQGKGARPIYDGTVRQAVFVNTDIGLQVLNYYPRWQRKETTPLLLVEDVIGIDNRIATLQLDGRNIHARQIQIFNVTRYGILLSSHLVWLTERMADPPNKADYITYRVWSPFITVRDVMVTSKHTTPAVGGAGLVGDGSLELANWTIRAPSQEVPLVTSDVPSDLLPRPIATYGVSSCSIKVAQANHQAMGPAVNLAVVPQDSVAVRDVCLLDTDGSLGGRPNNYLYARTQLLLGDFECKQVSSKIGNSNTCQCLFGTECHMTQVNLASYDILQTWRANFPASMRSVKASSWLPIQTDRDYVHVTIRANSSFALTSPSNTTFFGSLDVDEMYQNTWVEIRRPLRVVGGMPSMFSCVLTADRPLQTPWEFGQLDARSYQYSLQLETFPLQRDRAITSFASAWIENGQVVERLHAFGIPECSMCLSIWESVKPQELESCTKLSPATAAGCLQADLNQWWFTAKMSETKEGIVPVLTGFTGSAVSHVYGTPFRIMHVDGFSNLSWSVMPILQPCLSTDKVAAWPKKSQEGATINSRQRRSSTTSDQYSTSKEQHHYLWLLTFCAGSFVLLALQIARTSSPSTKSTKHDIHSASFVGDLDTIQQIADQSPLALQEQDALGRTPLVHAVIGDQGDAVKLLHSLDSNFRSTDNAGRTPLHWACMVGASQAATALLACYKPDLFMVDARGNTAAHAAANEGNLDVIVQMISGYCTSPAAAIALLHTENDCGQRPLDQLHDTEQSQQLTTILGDIWTALRDSGANDDLETIMKKQKALSVKRNAWHRAQQKSTSSP
eukprot:m.193848 g.193848  ORF g.193848 m.193848 type:complete len:1103 (-) comp16990_c0_seq5:1334-4642(-)